MKKIQPFIPFILMILGSFRFGNPEPFRNDGEFPVTILMALGYYFSLKTTKYQNIIKLSTIWAAAGFCVFYFSDFADKFQFYFKGYYSGRDEAYAHLLVSIGCGIIVVNNKSYIKELMSKLNKK